MTERNTEQRPHEVYNSYKGKTYGNILDLYDNPSYNLKLYMISPRCKDMRYSSIHALDNSGGAEARMDAPPADSSVGGEGGGYINNRYDAPPENTIVLAQTGVTGNQIDNLEIQSKVGIGNGESEKTIATFTITQVGHVNLYDQIHAAKARLGIPSTINDYPVFLEITFKGYSLNIDDPDEETGNLVTIGEPFIHRMIIKKIDLSIDENGSKYDCETVFVDTLSPFSGVSDYYRRIPKDLSVNGSTIDEFAAGIEDGLREYREEHETEHDVKDEVKIVVDNLFNKSRENGLFLESREVDTSGKDGIDAVNRILSADVEDETPEEHRQRVTQAGRGGFFGGIYTKSIGRIDFKRKDDKITFKKGTNLYRIFLALLSMNPEFVKNITRKENFADPNSTEVNKDQPLVWWLKINSTMEYIGFDRKGNRYAKRITYYPELYHLSGTLIQDDTEENKDISEADNQARFDALLILKSYDYIYTGLNDQIKSCNIEHNPGLVLLHASGSGNFGNRDIQQAPTLASNLEEDLSEEEQQARSRIKRDRQEKEEKEAVNHLILSAREETISKYADKFGFTEAEIKDILANRDSSSATKLKNILENKKTLQENIRNEDFFVGPLQPREIYTDTPSGTLYSADVLSETDIPALSEENAAIAAKQREDRREDEPPADNDNKEPDNSLVATFMNFISGGDSESTQTTDNSSKHSILAQIAENHLASEDSFLIKITMTIKGDPWWLGPPKKHLSLTPNDIPSLSTPEGVLYEKDQNYVFFTFQTPRLFDSNVDDEDDNTGYWKPEGISYFISGVYFPKSVNHSFSGGVFEQEIELIKEHGIRLSGLKKIPPEIEEEE